MISILTYFSCLAYAWSLKWLFLTNFVFIGTTEAFLHAVADETQLKRSNNSLLIFSAIYIILNVLLIRSAGAVGLITANSISILFDFSLIAYLFIVYSFWSMLAVFFPWPICRYVVKDCLFCSIYKAIFQGLFLLSFYIWKNILSKIGVIFLHLCYNK